MVKGHCTHSWLGSFAVRLIQLRPKMSVGRAVSCAVASIHRAADIDPLRAAEIFAQMNPISELDTQRRARQRMDFAAAGDVRVFGRLTHSTTPRAYG
jgi:hypothetical protein